MGIGVPSIYQVLVNQGFLVLGSCLQERVQVHWLQWDLGLRLSQQNKVGLSYSLALRPLSLRLYQSGPAHQFPGDKEWEMGVLD